MAKKDKHKNEVETEEELVEENLEDVVEEKEESTENCNCEKEIEEYKISLARLQADFMNYKKRTEKEKQGLIKYGIENFVCELLPILDNFQRAMESETKREDEFFKGVKMIENQIVQLLEKNGVEEIPSLNEEFDPNCHHAIVQEEVDGVDENIITGVLQKGYRLNDKVIRPSMVKVSK
jgi:molecular chaperone GrpE